MEDRVLVLAPIGRDAAAAVTLLREAGVVAAACGTLADLRDCLEEGAGAAIIAEEAFHRAPIEIISEWIVQQPPWSDFPFLVLTSSRTSAGSRLEGRRLMQMLRNVSLLERPVHTVTLLSAVRAALRGRQRQYELRGYLDEREHAAARLETLVADRTRALKVVNERLRAEMKDRQQAEAALLHAQKMKAIGQLTGGVAHDFNNLLTSILGNLEIVLEAASKPRVRKLVGNAIRSAERGARLTEQLLAFSRQQHLRPEPVDLNVLVTQMSEMLSSTMGAAIRIATILEKGIWPAMADPTQMELAILNLAINSRDAMPAGGRLTISTANIGRQDPRRSADLAPGDYVAVSVSDTGTGMTSDVLARAFEPFFTTKDVGRGTGLGLSQVYGVAQQLGGHVSIETTLGSGTTIHVYLPRAEGVARKVRQADGQTHRGVRHGAVLVVDDDDDVREVAVAALEGVGYVVAAASSGREALEAVDRVGAVDIVLLDYAMPEMNGLEAMRLIRQKQPATRVVLMTGHADVAELQHAAEREEVLRKPFTLDQLTAAVTGDRRG